MFYSIFPLNKNPSKMFYSIFSPKQNPSQMFYSVLLGFCLGGKYRVEHLTRILFRGNTE